MSSTSAAIEGWHAHIYYEAATRPLAADLRNQIAARFGGGEDPVAMGRWREQPVGPHPLPMYQVTFSNDLFGSFVPWLVANRNGFDSVATDAAAVLGPRSRYKRAVPHPLHAREAGGQSTSQRSLKRRISGEIHYD